MDVLVTGGTGVLGRHVVKHLEARGHTVRVLTHTDRGPGRDQHRFVVGDLRTGEGLRAAVTGVDAVVHAASDPRDFAIVDVNGTRRLLDAAAAAKPHVVYVSIVGADRIPWPYYRAKVEVEQMVEASGLPWTVLRATQFHEFTAELAQQIARLPVLIAPRGWRVQPVDVEVVAKRLADAVESGPQGRLPDVGGPEALSMTEALRAYAAAYALRRPVWTVPVPGKFSAAWQAGAALAPDCPPQGATWRQFLAGAAAVRP